MRLKKVKNAKNIIESSSYIILNPKDYKGKYKELFSNDNPIHLEIGMGKGDFLISKAKLNPNINFIGIEKFDSVIVRALQKLENTDLPNIKLIRFDALNINDIIGREIDTIYLNFSDPWPKNRHEERRLTNINFLKKYDLLFKGKNKIILKTDNRKFFEYSVTSLNNYNYLIKELSLNLYEDEYLLKDNIPTEYENRFVSLKLPIYYINVEKDRHLLDKN